MRRERSQSSDRGRPYVPRWDNPMGQLPGTGIPSGIDSGLYGTSRREIGTPWLNVPTGRCSSLWRFFLLLRVKPDRAL